MEQPVKEETPVRSSSFSPPMPGFADGIYQRILQRTEKFVAGPGWMLKTFLLCLAVSILLSGGVDMRLLADGPSASGNNGYGYGYSEGYFQKLENPWVDLTKTHDTGSHDAKLNLRLTVPVILHYLGLRSHWMLPLLTISAICAILIITCELVFRITGDRVSSVFASLSVASTYIGSFALISYYDAIALAQLCLAMLPGLNLWLKALLVFTASFTDERAFVASAFLLLPGLCLKRPGQNRFFKREFIAVSGGMAAYCIARAVVMKCTGLSTPHTGVNFYLFILQIKFLHVGTWFALEGGWLWVAAAALVLWRSKNRLAPGLMFIIIGVLLTGSFMVADVLRSAAYLLPVIFVALMVLADTKQIPAVRFYCFLAFLISLAGGNYNIFGDRIIWCRPLPVAIFEVICEIIRAKSNF